ncbi:glycosyl hydrolase family 18 protein [Paenibacillus chibensis]|uniref:Glycosyl hydrolase family 18 protein n=1 Tax=Paenibacillus chibensis TaxID=59846 RepID=A0ABU6PXB1_9BACL|nr:glycosyl hydrolase family 18 protein [Paenibacillus chibensis]
MLTNKWLVALSITIITAITAIYMGIKEQFHLDDERQAVSVEKELSSWVVDWQWKSGLEDFGKLAGGLGSLQLFAVYFDEADRLYMTEDLKREMPSVLQAAKDASMNRVYVTLVNDLHLADGTEVQKDPDLLTRLLKSEESRSKHIADIIDWTEQYGIQGVEIDYEKVSDRDWPRMTAFYSELYERLHVVGKSLRIVLESRAPIERLDLPKGPEYVMMAYNLYGTHSGPGPKADYLFLDKLARRMNHLAGDNIIAIAAGGFDWSGQGKVKAVTEKKASELARQAQVSPERDTASGSLHFEYYDDTGGKHTVWYADDKTLIGWLDTLRRDGYGKAAIWRLGELGENSVEQLRNWSSQAE